MTEQTDVVIVGAGPAGLAVAACLARAGVSFIILERNTKVGSSWRRHYERLHLHTVKQLSALPFVAFEADEPRYVPRARVVAYLERYAAQFALQPRFNETVRAVRRDRDDWLVDSTTLSIRARHVVIASGLNAEPVAPAIPGRERFGGRVVHSSDYANAAPFAGKSVLVIGMGNTGAEIALDLAEGGARPGLSLRNGVHVVPRDLFGIPIQRVAIAATAVLPARLLDVLLPPILDAALGWPARFGIRRPARGLLEQIAESGKIPVLDTGAIRKIAEGAITVRPGLETLTEDGAVFSDGRAEKFDAIVLATGYRPNDRDFLAVDGIASREMSSLHFVGFRSPVTGLLREISREAVAVAKAIAGSRVISL
jgi:cation diffusion facilitator CzcD-associated flavoprotein CzcO